jgi:hypothetical protein
MIALARSMSVFRLRILPHFGARLGSTLDAAAQGRCGRQTWLHQVLDAAAIRTVRRAREHEVTVALNPDPKRSFANDRLSIAECRFRHNGEHF